MLAVALLLGTTASALAAGDDFDPVEKNYPEIRAESEKPGITIQSNAVLNDSGSLTGYVEVALILDPGKVWTKEDGTVVETAEEAGENGTLEYQKFRYLSTGLEFSPQLHPVSWSVLNETTGIRETTDVDITNTKNFTTQVKMETLKDSKVTTAAAHVGQKTQSDGTPDPNGGGYVYFMVESTKPMEFTERTTLAVIRFNYDLTQITPLKSEPDAGKWTDPNDPACLIKLVSSLALAGSSYGVLPLVYRSEATAFYYADLPSGTAAPDPNGTTIPAANRLELRTNVTYELVNQLTYDPTARSNGGVIVYYDYTDELIGIQTVLPGDARAQVNEYVEKNFIAPDLRYSNHPSADYTDSLERFYNYRGIYPAEGPDGTTVYDPNAADAEDRLNGADWPLTNKLDYVFFKRVATRTETETKNDDGTVTVTYDWKTQHLSELDSGDERKKYPYVNGWAVIDKPENIENVWTTMGVGELGGVDLRTAGNTTFTTGGESSYFELADFSKVKNGDVIYVKAVYEPGELLAFNSDYRPLTEPAYERYGSPSTVDGGVYAISFSYGRINTAGYGVSRMRDPAIRIDYTPDIEGEAKTPFSVGIDMENKEVINVTFTPSSAMMSMVYSLRDKHPYDTVIHATKEYNFYTGTARSQHANLVSIQTNFDYEYHKYPNHLGSSGFVTTSTLSQIRKLCLDAIDTGIMTDVNAYITLDTLNDMNWKTNLSGAAPSLLTLTRTRNLVLDAYRAAKEHGRDTLGWHQIQYHIINATYTSATNITGGLHAGIPAENTLPFSWCRIDDCSGGADPIDSFEALRKALADYVGGNNNALLLLNSTWDLRTGITAVPFSDVAALKTALESLGDRLKTGSVATSDIESMTWRQLQYLLDPEHDTDTTIPATVTDDYWWENGGTRTITDLADLLTIAYHIQQDSYAPCWLDTLTVDQITGFKLRAVEGVGTPFTDVAVFKTKLATTMVTLIANGYTPATIASYAGVTNKLELETQHVLLGKPYADSGTLGNAGYWWITGAPDINDLKDLLTTAWQVYVDGADKGLLDNAKLELLDTYYLRGDEDGNKFADKDAFLAALGPAVTKLNAGGLTPADFADPVSSDNWDKLQSALLGKELNADPSGYWWKNGGSKPISDLKSLLEAAWNSYGGGGGTAPSDSTDPNAMNALKEDEATKIFINGIEIAKAPEGVTIDPADYLYLRTDENGTEFASVSDFRNAVQAAIDKVWFLGKDFVVGNVPDTPGTQTGLSWIEFQHLLIPGTGYVGKDELESDYDYWWEAGKSKAEGSIDVDKEVEKYAKLISEIEYGSGGDAQTVVDQLATVIEALKLQKKDGSEFKKEDAQALYDIFAAAATAVQDLEDFDYYNLLSEDESYMILTWRELQQYILTDNLICEETAGFPSYSWKPSGEVVVVDAAKEVGKLAKTISEIVYGSSEDPQTVVDQLATVIEALKLQKQDGSEFKKEDAQSLYDIFASAATAVQDLEDFDYYNLMSEDDSYMILTWGELQQYILTNNLICEETADFPTYSWAPAGVSAASVFAVRRSVRATAPRAVDPIETTEATVSEDGLTTTTTHTLMTYNSETASWDTVVTVTVVTETEAVTVTTTTVVTTSANPETGKPVTTTTTDTVTAVKETAEEKDPEKTGEPEKTETPEGTETPPKEGETSTTLPEETDAPLPGETEPPTETETPEPEPGETPAPEETEVPDPETPKTETPEATEDPDPETPKTGTSGETPAQPDPAPEESQPPDKTDQQTTEEEAVETIRQPVAKLIRRSPGRLYAGLYTKRGGSGGGGRYGPPGTGAAPLIIGQVAVRRSFK